jgi:hypothetical protein
MKHLPLETQTLYAQFMGTLLATEAQRSIGGLAGCFTTKTVKGLTYCYFQYSDPGGFLRQVYLGRKNAVLDRVIENFVSEREAFKPDTEHLQRLCAQLRAGGALVTDTASSRILKALSDSGVFHMGAVLVGTHAFIVLGNLLGVKWRSSALRTQDLDIGTDASMSIGVPYPVADHPDVLERLEMGFLPVPSLNPKHPSTSFKVRGKSIRVDLLTPQRSRKETSPKILSWFKAAAQPLPYLDYVIEGFERGAVVDGGGILVNVPSPGRFAFHKLLISGERGAVAHTKMGKDVLQAAQVLSVLVEERPGDVRMAWDEINRRGTGWMNRVSSGLSQVKRLYPDEYKKIATFLSTPLLNFIPPGPLPARRTYTPEGRFHRAGGRKLRKNFDHPVNRAP